MDTYLLGSALIVFGIYHMGYYNYLSDWVRIKKQRFDLFLNILNTLQNPSSVKSHQSSFTVNDTDISANILYERLGNEYILFVPYNRSFVAPMSQFKTELLRKNAISVDITQQPGIPYMVTAAEIGGYAIKITNQETNMFHEYDHETCPMYGEEVIFKE
jgi:hypothetical protein